MVVVKPCVIDRLTSLIQLTAWPLPVDGVAVAR